MKFYFVIVSSLFFSSLKAQTFYVTGHDIYSVNKISEKIKFEGYKVTDSSNADYLICLLIDGAYNPFSLKRNFQGYITINERGTGKEIYKSPVEKASPSIYNGYNASYTVFNKISKRYLAGELAKIPKSGENK
jgi:hypothetical protein